MERILLEECKSPWNSPLVVVPKKDWSIQMCLDFRRLNDVTEKYTFPVRDIHTLLLDSLNGSVVFTSIDLGQAYYQVELDPDSQLKTAFSTKIVQFCFKRLPFGLCTATATFQSLMNLIFKDLIYKGVIVYLDDILMYARAMKNMIDFCRKFLDLINYQV